MKSEATIALGDVEVGPDHLRVGNAEYSLGPTRTVSVDENRPKEFRFALALVSATCICVSAWLLTGFSFVLAFAVLGGVLVTWRFVPDYIAERRRPNALLMTDAHGVSYEIFRHPVKAEVYRVGAEVARIVDAKPPRRHPRWVETDVQAVAFSLAMAVYFAATFTPLPDREVLARERLEAALPGFNHQADPVQGILLAAAHACSLWERAADADVKACLREGERRIEQDAPEDYKRVISQLIDEAVGGAFPTFWRQR